MDIQSVKLRGFKGIKKGMGLDEIELDFRDVAGMIAISGPTGIGKSTIIENLHPYPQLVSRPNPVLKNHVSLRDSLKELSFIHNGDLFRTVTKIDAQSGRTEGYIYVNGSDKSETDGKITQYKDFCIQNFGSTDLFFNSVFSAQNSKKMSAMDPADLKSLFVEFLGRRLEILVQQEELSKGCSNILLSTLDSLQRDISKQNDIIMEHSDAATRLVRAEDRKSHLDHHEVDVGMLITKLESGLCETAKVKLLNTGYQERIDILENDYRDIGLDIDNLNGDDNVARRGFQTERVSLDGESEKASGILLQKEVIEGAVEKEKDLTQEINDKQTKKLLCDKRLHTLRETLYAQEMEANEAYRIHTESLNSKIDERRTLEQKLEMVRLDFRQVTTQRKAAENDPEITNLHQRLDTCKEAADAKRGTVKCEIEHGYAHDVEFDCNSTDCPQIEKALKAEKEIPRIEIRIGEVREANSKELKALTVKEAGLLSEGKMASKEVDSLKQTEKNFCEVYVNANAKRLEAIGSLSSEVVVIEKESDSLENNIARIQKEITEAKELAAKLHEIKVAEARLKDLAEEREKLEARTAIQANAHKLLIETKIKKMSTIQVTIDNTKEKIDTDINDKIAHLEAKIKNEKFTLGANQDELKRLEAQIFGMQANVKTANAATFEMAQLQKRRIFIAGHQSGWRYIQNKCGKDGIQALEINSIAPTITHYGNALLEYAMGAWAMVDFETLDPETGKEVLRPMVIDQDGDRVLVANRSGGQQVWAMKALRLAMTMVSKEKSGLDYLSAYADEDDSGLDIETAVNYTKLYRAFLVQGKFSKVFYISHKPQCVELADHIITLGPGGTQ